MDRIVFSNCSCWYHDKWSIGPNSKCKSVWYCSLTFPDVLDITDAFISLESNNSKRSYTILPI